MMSTSRTPEVRCVLVALDDATLGRDTLEAAVDLAADLDADIQGLYFQNDVLLRAVPLPFLREIITDSATERPLDMVALRQALQAQARHAEHLLDHWAKSAQIRCSFAVARQRVSRQRLLAGPESDVVFFGCRSHAPSVRRPWGMRARTRPLMLLVDDSPRGERVVAAAAAVTRRRTRPAILLVLSHSPDRFVQLGRDASEQLTKLELPHTLLPHPVTTTSALIQSARDQRPGLLLVNRHCELISEKTLESMLDLLDCPIVLV